jgi:hypothetical protein
MPMKPHFYIILKPALVPGEVVFKRAGYGFLINANYTIGTILCL